MDRPTCRTCLYFEPDEPDKPSIGECHRMPPDSRLEDGVTIWWKILGCNDWCGEHPDFPAYIRRLKGDGRTISTLPWSSIDPEDK